jgi:hypothetical protein
LKWALGIGIPVVVIIIWGTFFAPKASHRLNATPGILLSTALFLTAALALAQTGHSGLAIAMALITFLNRGLIWLWRQW